MLDAAITKMWFRNTIASSLAIVFLTASLITCIDLNMPPEEHDYDEGTPASKVTLERAKKLRAVYAKVLKLFDILKMCDVEDFDVNRFGVPKSFTEQEKAMMLLNRVARSNLIKTRDMPRYERIMRNCGALSAAYQKSVSADLSIESQMSGIHYSDAMEMKRNLEQSPIDGLRRRFSEFAENERRWAIKSEAISNGAIVAKSPSRKQRATTAKPNLGVVLAPRAVSTNDGQAMMYNFI